MSSIMLVCIKNYQNYIIDNIIQLINNGEKNIYVITNKIFEDNYKQVTSYIKLLFVEDVDEEYNYHSNSSQCHNFRNGFFVLTSERFFYIYQFMKKYNLINCIHIENDVLLYHNINEIVNSFNENYIYLPFDCYKRNIASIMYIPNHTLLKNVLDKYNYQLNDMYNFMNIKNETNMITNFPIFSPSIKENLNNEELFVSENYNLFNYIFDAAAIGQYLGGIDPSNIPGDTTGFINETCIIKYNNYNIIFEDKKPYIETFDGKKIPIFNLHIHCKNLKKFMCNEEIQTIKLKNPLFDVVICVGPNDSSFIHHSINYTKKNICGYRNIYLISYDKNIVIDECITIDENIFPFNKNSVSNYLGINDRNGWYLQQILKMYAGNIIPNILDYYLVIDADTLFLKPINFFYDNNLFYHTIISVQNHLPYLNHMSKLHPILKKSHPSSGISHNCMFNKLILNELFNFIEQFHNNGKQFWQIFLEMIDKNDVLLSGASEYEIYFTYLILFHSNKFSTRNLKFIEHMSYITDDIINNYDYMSQHWYCR